MSTSQSIDLTYIKNSCPWCYTDIDRVSASKSNRHGLTIIEVIFAIGIILVGLLGVAALIPIAAEDANTSIRNDAALRFGASALAELRARDFQTLNNLYHLDVDTRNDDGLSPNSSFAFKSLQSQAPLDSPSMSPFRLATGRRAAFCIDPWFLSQHQNDDQLQSLPSTRSAYQRARFPYYDEYYTGLPDPNLQRPIGNGVPIPRLWRVGYGAPSTSPQFLPPLLASWLTSSDNELTFTKADDRLAPVGQIVDPLTSAVVGARQTENRFSWFATLCPPLDGGSAYKLSIVVAERRNVLDVPRFEADPQEKFDSERVAWVTDAVSLGSTIEAEVTASSSVSDKIVSGQWVLLSQQIPISPNQPDVPHPTIPAAHRWFRVAQVGPSKSVALPVGASSINVWQRRIVLDGPNWTFNLTTLPQPTSSYLTIVSGAVAVIESDLRIP